MKLKQEMKGLLNYKEKEKWAANTKSLITACAFPSFISNCKDLLISFLLPLTVPPECFILKSMTIKPLPMPLSSLILKPHKVSLP
jgi:hypothetical protein